MEDLRLLVWLSQLGLTVAVPPAAFVLLGVWLRNRFGWGQWVVWVAIALGIYCGAVGFVSSLRTMSRFAKEKEQQSKTVSFHEHD